MWIWFKAISSACNHAGRQFFLVHTQNARDMYWSSITQRTQTIIFAEILSGNAKISKFVKGHSLLPKSKISTTTYCSVQPIFQIGLSLPPVQDLCCVNWNHKEWIFSEMAVMDILQRRTAQGTRHDTSTEPAESENSFQRFELHFSFFFLLRLYHEGFSNFRF